MELHYYISNGTEYRMIPVKGRHAVVVNKELIEKGFELTRNIFRQIPGKGDVVETYWSSEK